MRLFQEVYGIDEHGRLGTKLLAPEQKDSATTHAINWYHTWLSFQQIAILERMIKPLENENQEFEPDHQIIVEALRKAHLLPLDEKCQNKLEALTAVYMKMLDEEAQTRLKADMAYWATLPKSREFQLWGS